MNAKILQGDAVKWAKEYDGELFHALLCDPPYHLTSIVKRFGKGDSAPAQFGKDGVYSRSSRGFMGKQWDGGDVAFDPETWAAFSGVMYPGAFGMAFASSRGWHRLAVAIEDGGFIIHPSIFGWSYGSGFPKATRVKADGFEGYRYGLQAMKPALEPIIVFQKPYEGRPIDNITQTGAGVLNIDGARISMTQDDREAYEEKRRSFDSTTGKTGNGWKLSSPMMSPEQLIENSKQGRWPANFILLDDGAAEALDKQSGSLVAGTATSNSGAMGYHGGKRGSKEEVGYKDEGGASRFFFRVQEQIDSADPVYYEAKASTEERDAGLSLLPEHERRGDWATIQDARPHMGDNYVYEGKPVRNPHPTVKPLALARYLATLLLPPAAYAPRRLFVPFAGVASEMIGAFQAGWDDVTGVELTEEYIPIAEARMKYWQSLGFQASLPIFEEVK